ncbi:MAG: RidA family protein [Clostridia bacterium]|nr:RidA family protein [Clostridia bacterium]
MEKVATNKAPAAIGPYSQAIKHGDLVFTSGQIAIDPAVGDIVAKDIAGQTEQVMKNLCEVLRAAGSAPELVIKTTCFLANIGDFAAFNGIYGKYFTEKPARSCVAAAALPKGALVEVEAIALLAGKDE